MQVGALGAKNNLSGLIRRLDEGLEEQIVISRNNRPVARLVRYKPDGAARRIGIVRDQFTCTESWDSPELNAEVAELFEAAL